MYVDFKVNKFCLLRTRVINIKYVGLISNMRPYSAESIFKNLQGFSSTSYNLIIHVTILILYSAYFTLPFKSRIIINRPNIFFW